MLLLSFFVLAAAEQGDVTFDGTLGSCVLSAGSDAGTVCDVKYMYRKGSKCICMA
jgi:hypothetical protein